MNPEQFQKDMAATIALLEKATKRAIPIKMAEAMEAHTKDNFHKSGFLNGGLKQWKPSKRIGKAKGPAGSRKTLFGETKNLYNSTHHRTQEGTAIVYNDCPYAEVHNEGLHAGRGAGFTMPRRQFIGDSKELTEKTDKILDDEFFKILNK